jgi:hypothetical protein
MKYLSVADNEGDAVILHVPASSERQGCGNKTWLKKKRKKANLKTQSCLWIYFDVSLYNIVSD